MSDTLPPLREVVAALGLNAKKSLGQHFLFDLNLTRRIARAGGPLDDACIIEVGPGPGGLTRALLAEGASDVIAIERDARALPALAAIEAACPGRFRFIEGDALKLPLGAISGGAPVRVVANLPYNIGTELLIRWLDAEPWPPVWKSLTLMFQKEVARRIVAAPGEDGYGRLALFTAFRAKAQFLFEVDARAFTPPPQVTSAVVRIEPLPGPRSDVARRFFETVTAAAFGQRRKMLRASLRGLAPDAEALIAAAGIDPQARAETLDFDAFAALARAFAPRLKPAPSATPR